MKHTRLFLLVLLLSTPFTFGCAALTSGLEKGENIAANILIPTSEEIRLGAQFSQEIEQDITLHPDPQVQAYVQELGTLLARNAPDRNESIEFKFKVVQDNNTVNAFALPGGWIYVYSGLILAAENESELAGVLGHEVAHVTRRHVPERLVASQGLEAIQQVILGQNNSLLTSLAGNVVSNGFLLKYGRDQETEADNYGVDYLINAGYNPSGFIAFFEKLKAAGGGESLEILSSHPHPDSRIQNLRERLKKRGNLPQKTNSPQFDAIRAKLR